MTQNMKLIQSAIRCENTISSNTNEIGKVVERLNKGTFIVNGLYAGKDVTLETVVAEFLKKEMEIEEDI